MSLIPQAILWAAIIISGKTALNTTNTSKHSDKDFVDVLKLKLRKNNDDYAELLVQNTTASVITSTVYENKTELDVTPPLNVVDVRRSFVQPNNSKQDIAIIWQDVVNLSTNLHDSTIATNITKNGTRLHFRSDDKNMNKNKIEHFNKFMSKNKKLFGEYWGKKRTPTAPQTAHAPTLAPMLAATLATTLAAHLTSQPATTASGPNLRGMNHRDITFMPDEKSTKVEDRKEGPTPKYRAYSKYFRFRSSLGTPKPEQLDMAPAKGSRIHVMRLKGRLCQRNVMVPEGPKYDSKGHMYLGGYTNKYGRDYSRTRRPKIVLPRCCNCCKKSVLGCE